MKRRIASFWMVCLLVLAAAALTGCGKDAAQPAVQPAAQTAETTEVKSPTEAKPVVVEEPAEEAQPEETAEAVPEEPVDEVSEPSMLDTALSLVDQDVAELVDALGEPLEKTYEESCSGPGDDGIWTYDGLTVFTYVEDGVEIVVDAE